MKRKLFNLRRGVTETAYLLRQWKTGDPRAHLAVAVCCLQVEAMAGAKNSGVPAGAGDAALDVLRRCALESLRTDEALAELGTLLGEGKP